MAAACSPRCARITACVLIVLALLLLVTAFVVPPVVYGKTDERVADKSLVDSPDAPDYDNWLTSTDPDDTPVFVEVLFFNVTNAAELRAGTATHIDVDEVGPYTWRKHVRKYNVTFVDGGRRVRYYTHEWHEYSSSRSRNGADPERDTIYTPSLSYVALMRTLGSEAALRAVVLGGALAQVYARTVAASPFSGSRTAFAGAWGTAGTPGNARQPFPGAPSSATFFLTYADYLTASPFAAQAAALHYNATTTETLLFSPARGLLVNGGAASGGVYWLTAFLQYGAPCAAAGFNVQTSTACATIGALWPALVEGGGAAAAARIGAMLSFFQDQLATVATYTWDGAKAANGGTLFAPRTPNQLLFTGLARDNVTGVVSDPLLALVGKQGSSLLCENKERVDDPCAFGFTEQLTGREHRHDAQVYTMARSMSVLPALNTTFCDPLSACDEQTAPSGRGIWRHDVRVNGHASGVLGVGRSGVYQWHNGVSSNEHIVLWSDSLMRPVTLHYAATSRVHSVDTLRFALAHSTADVNPTYFQSIKGLLNRTSLARGAPVFGVPNRLVGLTLDEARELLPPTLRVTTLERCVTGNGTCLLSDRAAALEASTYFDVEPKTGFTMSAHERLTTVLEVRRFVDGDYTQLPSGLTSLDGGFFLPIAAVDKYATIASDDADALSDGLAFQNTADILLIVLASLGAACIVLVVIVCCACACRDDDDDDASAYRRYDPDNKL